jgi:hypothetical protein
LKRQKRVKSPRRELFAYDGHRFIGKIVVGTDGRALASDAANKKLGKFSDLRAAFRAVSSASGAATQRNESSVRASRSAIIVENAIGALRGNP